jgi:peroxiredoxin
MMCALLLAAAAAVTTMAGPDDPLPLPRYRLEPGQTIETTSIVEGRAPARDGQPERVVSRSESITSYWIVGRNADGSARVLVRVTERSLPVPGQAEGAVLRAEEPARLAYFDVFADGRSVPNPTTEQVVRPEALFPALPRDEAERRAGWTVTSGDGWESATYRVVSATPELWTIEGTQTTGFDLVYPREKVAVQSTIDPVQGRLVGKVRTDATEAMRAEAKKREPRYGTIGDEERARLAEESGRYFDLIATALAIRSDPEAMRTLDAAVSCYDRVGTLLRDAAGTFREPMFAEAAEGIAKRVEESRASYVESMRGRMARIGQPAPAWKLDDLDGNSHSLEQYRGKVVVIDFWYRDCPWCLRGMPGLKQVAAEMGPDVVLLGLNTDAKVEDARFVAKVMELTYPTLVGAKALPKAYGVEGYPTVYVIAPDGTIADIHVGYSAELREAVLKSIARARGGWSDEASGGRVTEVRTKTAPPPGATPEAGPRGRCGSQEQDDHPA